MEAASRPHQGSQLRAKAEAAGGPASRWVWLDHRCLKDSRTRSATDPATGHPEILREGAGGPESNGTGAGLPGHGVKENELLAQAANLVRR